MLPLRMCHIGVANKAGAAWQTLERARELGFDTVLAAAGNAEAISPAFAKACESRGLSLFLDINLYELDLQHPLVAAHPESFAIRRVGTPGTVVDPRHPLPGNGCAYLRKERAEPALIRWWLECMAGWLKAGVRGFRMLKPASTPEGLREAFIGAAARHGTNRVTFIADTTGEPRQEVLALSGFEFTLSSLPWWDGRAHWLVDEYEALSRVAPVLAYVASDKKPPPPSSRQRCGRLAIALATGTGVLMPLSYSDAESEDDQDVDLAAAIRAANEFVATRQWVNGQLRSLTGAGAPITVVMRAEGGDRRFADRALVALINPDPIAAVEPPPVTFSTLGDFNKLEPVATLCESGDKFRPGEVRLFHARRMPLIVRSGRAEDRDVAFAVRSPRVVIAAISPAVDEGAFATKAVVGEQVTITADIFADGHPVLAAELQFRADGDASWQRTRMHLAGNDRWSAIMPLERVGRYQFAVEAWVDPYGTYVRDLTRKHEAGLTLTLELREGQQLLDDARRAANGSCAQALAAILGGFEALPDHERVGLLLAAETVELMRRADVRELRARTKIHCVESERIEARFASWYELFPRSQTSEPARHGTLRDVIARLPLIRNMGFNVLYFPPIHPVGKTNRKGRNNALKAESDDVGSVYAIGSSEGGHDTIHPKLGTLQDFQVLVSAAHKHGLEIALDFAVQASPDHPWLSEHPYWFDWRPDGSIKYAENPPKKYEDIVNVDFYARDARPDLWLALRDIIVFWIAQGVKIFRVDNPHTKPFPFWEWLIADVRGSHPDVIFLAEAFTRPKVMYHLAKLGFSQSYTYFTWRHTKQEITEYVRELNTSPVADFFRPHFFVNTPDINPFFLQTSGRAGFLIRAALASTLSGLWGLYSGFELCEADPLPGREEYLDSEKYEIKVRDWDWPGNIIAEITQLNRLRQQEPTLQTHLGVTFYNAFNDSILYFGKRAPGHQDRVLVAINLDPHNQQGADFEIPLWEWGRGDHETLECEDLLRGTTSVWRGKMQHMHLTPEAPYAIWRAQPPRDA